jgi:hypothetical protein
MYAALLPFIRHHTIRSLYHQGGTCTMKKRLTAALLLVLALCLLLAGAQAETCTLTEIYTAGVELPGDDELFAAYVEREMYEPIYGEIAPFGTLAYDRLNADHQKLYAYLKPGVEQIACGERSTTEFVLDDPAAQLGLDVSFTAEELGVSALVVGGRIPEDVVAAFQAALRGRLGNAQVYDALLADCPYDMYWNLKTGTRAFTFSMSISANSREIWLGKATYSFQVASPYGSGTSVDVSVTGSTAAAVRWPGTSWPGIPPRMIPPD